MKLLGVLCIEPQVLDQNIDTVDATGRLLFNILGAIAQFETEIRAERQMDGIKNAKERGVAFGRKKKLNKDGVAMLQQRRADFQKRASTATSGLGIPKLKVAAKLQNIPFWALCQNTRVMPVQPRPHS